MLLVFVLLLCASRSWCAGERCSVSVDTPVSVCRYKKPFPFQCVRLSKKRLSAPPLPNLCPTYDGEMLSQAPDAYWPLCAGVRVHDAGRIAIPAFAAQRYACAVGLNVFHPPPACG